MFGGAASAILSLSFFAPDNWQWHPPPCAASFTVKLLKAGMIGYRFRNRRKREDDLTKKHRNGRRAGLLAAIISLSCLLPGGALAQDKPLIPVRAAYVPVATWLPAWVALDKGIFAKHGLAVTLTAIQNLSLLPGTVGRQFEFAASTPTDLLKAVAG